jgi:hypothetical protein
MHALQEMRRTLSADTVIDLHRGVSVQVLWTSMAWR